MKKTVTLTNNMKIKSKDIESFFIENQDMIFTSWKEKPMTNLSGKSNSALFIKTNKETLCISDQVAENFDRLYACFYDEPLTTSLN